MARPENGERHGEEDAAAAERHGQVVPEEHLRFQMVQGEGAGRDEDGQNGELRDVQEQAVIADAEDHAGDIVGDHGAHAESQPADGADEGEQDASEGDACDDHAFMVDEVGGEHQNGEHRRIEGAHVHADGDEGQAHGNDDARRGDAPRRRRGGRGRGENGLYIGLGADDAHHHGEEGRRRGFRAVSGEAQPGHGREERIKFRIGHV